VKSEIADIKHIWWDFDGTLYRMPSDLEDLKYKRRYELYSEIVGKPITDELKSEYRKLYERHGSHSAVFIALGKKKDYWQKEHQSIDLIPYLKPDKKTVSMFHKFREFPYAHSIFTNRKSDHISKILRYLEIDETLFIHLLTNDDLVHPKPHTEGFERMVTLSKLEPHRLLFVGDRVETDILPAKAVGLQTALVWTDKKQTEADYSFAHVGDVITLFM
jgi:HAD superfamily hydrolase (TIGR01549 family)